MHLSKNCNSITLSNLATSNKSAFIALILLVGYSPTTQQQQPTRNPRKTFDIPLPSCHKILLHSIKFTLQVSHKIFTGSVHIPVSPVEYAVVQSPVKLLVSSSWGSSIPESTSRGMMGSHSNTRSSVVWETEIGDGLVNWHPLKHIILVNILNNLSSNSSILLLKHCP